MAFEIVAAAHATVEQFVSQRNAEPQHPGSDSAQKQPGQVPWVCWPFTGGVARLTKLTLV